MTKHTDFPQKKQHQGEFWMSFADGIGIFCLHEWWIVQMGFHAGKYTVVTLILWV